MLFGHLQLPHQRFLGLSIAHWAGFAKLRARQFFAAQMLIYLTDFVIVPICPHHFCSYLLVYICTHISEDLLLNSRKTNRLLEDSKVSLASEQDLAINITQSNMNLNCEKTSFLGCVFNINLDMKYFDRFLSVLFEWISFTNDIMYGLCYVDKYSDVEKGCVKAQTDCIS